jgi:hypothetical protein
MELELYWWVKHPRWRPKGNWRLPRRASGGVAAAHLLAHLSADVDFGEGYAGLRFVLLDHGTDARRRPRLALFILVHRHRAPIAAIGSSQAGIGENPSPGPPLALTSLSMALNFV